ncbi:cation transport protein-domain-containing protein [Naematelia encephala]|uniref:Cation transport protein-domain-containing protein n=1 Tax=Naematelia encephala TaxID=71784 RepID=A0A1Y2AJW3_9TREE|nr:cation transport protein-domain-containing protein [Naematelia encephala]
MAASKWLGKTWASLFAQLNWFRIHLLAFTIIPFIFSGFFMAANPSSTSGQFSTSYIDALFMCFSAMTVTGLSTLSLSELRPAQQAFLLILMLVGDISIVNLVTIFCRQIWFMQNCHKVVHSTILATLHSKHKSSSGYDDAERGQQKEPGIEGEGNAQRGGRGTQLNEKANRKPDDAIHGGKSRNGESENGQREHKRWEQANGKEQEVSNQPQSSRSSGTLEGQRHLLKPSSSEHNFWEESVKRRAELRRRSGHNPRPDRPRDPHGSIPHASSGRALHTGRGGFPSLHRIIYHLLHRTFPTLYTSLDNLLRHYETEGVHSSHPIRSLGKALGRPIEDHRDANEEIRAKNAKWLPPGVRGVVVGRNSQFFEEELDDEDLELIGALEYRATTVLTILLIVHQLFWMLIPSAILAIYFAKVHTWDTAFIDNGVYQAGTISSTWYSFFQVVSAYTSCGLSLVDILMVPFQNCYLLIYVLIFPMLAGNQAIPLFLRVELWLLTKLVKKGSELEVSLHFLLTHSRRLFLYLFPAYQTWYLVFVQFALTAIGVLGYVAFDHGLPYYKSISTAWDNFTISFFESLSVRASGFGIVFISDIAPATM